MFKALTKLRDRMKTDKKRDEDLFKVQSLIYPLITHRLVSPLVAQLPFSLSLVFNKAREAQMRPNPNPNPNPNWMFNKAREAQMRSEISDMSEAIDKRNEVILQTHGEAMLTQPRLLSFL